MTKLTHLDEQGQAHMVDVSAKAITVRSARAGARVRMKPETLALIVQGGHAKGDVLATARIAGIQAAKRTWELIPLCHPLLLSKVSVEIEVDPNLPGLRIESLCRLAGQTGVEMEALTAASVAALTIYDMCKAVDREMIISDLRVLEKRGGKSGDWNFDDSGEQAPQLRPHAASAAVQPLTASVGETATLDVRFFAELREQVPEPELQLELAQLTRSGQARNVAGLIAWLSEQQPAYAQALARPSLLVAVNQRMSDSSCELKAGDEVAFFPPVTGG